MPLTESRNTEIRSHSGNRVKMRTSSSLDMLSLKCVEHPDKERTKKGEMRSRVSENILAENIDGIIGIFKGM